MPDLRALFWPRSIALVGASPDATIIRGRIVQAVRHHGFDGPLHLISRSHARIDGLTCLSSVSALPADVDLAIITIPAKHVARALEACGERGVKAAIVISSGFAEERGGDGAERQSMLGRIAQRFDMALIGPNAEGFLNAAAPLAATFSPTVLDVDGGLLPEGQRSRSIAVVSQSGGVGFSFFHRGRPSGLAFSFIVSMGNEAGLDSMDVVEYLLDDRDTGVVLVFLEGLRAPDKLIAVAAKAARLAKPLVIAKIGSSTAGAAAAASHTASLSGSHRSYLAAFKHHGIIAGEDGDQMLDLAACLAFFSKRLPRGRRVGIVTPSGGAGAWLADICEAHGLLVPELDSATRAAIDELLPSYGTSRNPVDITAQAIFEHGYAPAIERVAASQDIDAVLVASSLSHATYIERDIDTLKRLGASLTKPVIFCAYTRANPHAVALLAQAGFACLTSMPNAARAVAAMASLQAWRERDAEPRASVTAMYRNRVRSALAELPDVVCEYQAKALLSRFDVQTPDGRLVNDSDAAREAATDLGMPVAMKVQSANIAHKSDAGAVGLDIASDAEAGDAFARIMANARRHAPDANIEGVWVERMAKEGIELIIGINRDPDFGSMLAVGFGGIFVDLLDDVALCPVPLNRAHAEALLDELRARAVLDGARGTPARDVDALLTLMVTLSEFAAAAGDALQAIDLNPVIVHAAGDGITVADALIVKTLPTTDSNGQRSATPALGR